jgi:hypothetical protein
MSLIELRWVGVAASGALAVAVPLMLINGDDPKIDLPAPSEPTEVAPSDAGSLAFALSAPPFSVDRTPEGSAEIAEEAAAEAAPPPPPAPPVLVGVVTGGRKSVVLAKGSGGDTLTLAPGQTVDGWRLVSIRGDRATFDLGGMRHVAELDFSNRGGGSSGAPSPSAPPQPPRPPEAAPPQ